MYLCKLIVGLEDPRLQLDRLFKRLLGTGPVLQLDQHGAQLLVVTGRVGVDGDRLLQVITRALELAHLHMNDRQVPEDLVVLGIDRSGTVEQLGRVGKALLLGSNDPLVHLVHRLDTSARTVARHPDDQGQTTDQHDMGPLHYGLPPSERIGWH